MVVVICSTADSAAATCAIVAGVPAEVFGAPVVCALAVCELVVAGTTATTYAARTELAHRSNESIVLFIMALPLIDFYQRSIQTLALDRETL